MIERFETFTYLILEISQYWNKIATEEMKCYGLKGAYAIYLVALRRHPDGITAAKLCEICHKDKAEISRSLSVLESKGLAVRENVTKNSYRALVKLTDAGIKAVDYVCQRVNVAVNAASKGLSDEKRGILYEALELIGSNLKTISEEGLAR